MLILGLNQATLFALLCHIGKLKVETGKFTKKSENQQNVTIIFSGEETYKIDTDALLIRS